NPNAEKNEQALRELLDVAHNANIPVYFGVDVLTWGKNRENTTNIFNKISTIQAINKEFTRSDNADALYASPFNKKTGIIMIALLKELATKFPTANGVALNMHLSRQETLGFSDAARIASIKEI